MCLNFPLHIHRYKSTLASVPKYAYPYKLNREGCKPMFKGLRPTATTLLAHLESKFCHFTHVRYFSRLFCSGLCVFCADRRGQDWFCWFTACAQVGFWYACQDNSRCRSMGLGRTVASSNLFGKVSTSVSLSGKP